MNNLSFPSKAAFFNIFKSESARIEERRLGTPCSLYNGCVCVTCVIIATRLGTGLEEFLINAVGLRANDPALLCFLTPGTNANTWKLQDDSLIVALDATVDTDVDTTPAPVPVQSDPEPAATLKSAPAPQPEPLPELEPVPEPTVVPSTAAASVTAASFEVLIKSQVTSVHSGIGTGNVLTYLWRAVDRRCVKVWRWTQRKFPRHLAACSRLAL